MIKLSHCLLFACSYLGASTAALALPDLSTTISGPMNATTGQTVYYYANTTNVGDAAVPDAVVTILLAGRPAAATVIVTGGSYNASTGVVTFNTSSLAPSAGVTNLVRFVVPAGVASVTGQAASSSATTTDAGAANNDGSRAAANVTTVIGATGASGTAAACATPRKDGIVTLTTLPNTYYPSTANQTLAAGATSLSVGSSRGAATTIVANDLLLIVQMQGASFTTTDGDTYGDGVAGPSANGSSVGSDFVAGRCEYVKVASVSGNTLTLSSGLVNSYQSAAATATAGQRSFQVVRVPQYQALTLGADLSPLPWNGSTGGILAFDVVGQLDFNTHTLNASGAGFRGGAGRRLTGVGNGTTLNAIAFRTSAASPVSGSKGEGIAGTPRYVNDNGRLLDTQTAAAGVPTTLTQADGYPGGDNGRGAPGNAGGGATDNSPANNFNNAGGGGGANGGRGGRGGNAWASGASVGGEPGAAFPTASSSRLVLGGGGGAGSNNDGTGDAALEGLASSGAAGGGIVLVRTGTVSGTGAILANGASASSAPLNDGSGGAGAGGSILLTAATSGGLSGLTLQATGGAGGSNTPGAAGTPITGPHGPGGGGGGGVILTNGAAGPTTAAAGPNGTSQNAGSTTASAYGAEAGTVGVDNAAISITIAGSTAGASCAGPLPVTLVRFEAQATGTSAQLSWLTASELNNAYFAVERSLRGESFTQIGEIAGQGSKPTATSYALTDRGIGQQAMGAVYYRLRQIDMDGTSTYSPVRVVHFRAMVPAIGLYPNPAAATTTLDLRALPGGIYQVRLLDATGRTVQEQAIAAGQTYELSTASLPSGTFLVLVQGLGADGNSIHLTQRLFRQ